MSNLALLVAVYLKLLREVAVPLILIGCTWLGIRIQHWYDLRNGKRRSLRSHSARSYAPLSNVRPIAKPQVYDWSTDPNSGLVGSAPRQTNQPTKES